MLNRIRAVVVATALGAAALVALPGTAMAAARAPEAPKIVKLAASDPTVLVKGGDKVKVTFTITVDGKTEKAPKAVEAYLKPAGLGVESKLTLASPERTKWTGSYEFDRKSPVGVWTLRASAKNDAGEDTARLRFQVKQVWETKIEAFKAVPRKVKRGGDVTVWGRLLINGNDGWKPYGGQKVGIEFARGGGYRAVESDRTDRRGWFRAKVKAWATGTWRASFAGVDGRSHPSTGAGERVFVERKNRETRIDGFRVSPAQVTQGDKVTVTGRLKVKAGRDWDGYRNQKVEIQFRPGRFGKWETVATDWTGRGGRFWKKVVADKTGWWRVEYDGRRGVEDTATRPVLVRVSPAKAATRVTGFDAYPEPLKPGRHLKFRGVLEIQKDGTWVGYGKQKVSLHYKPIGKDWTEVKTFWTDEQGKFWTKVKVWRSGSWKLVFAGNDTAAAAESDPDPVRVRGRR